MFDNKFLKKDPLVEAVKQAQADGDMRRQAIATVNEQFGVYSRNAVIRENLAAYDAAVEEAYKCMKEGNKDNKEKKKEHEEKVGMEHIKKMGGFPGQSLKRTARSLTKEEMKLADKDYDRDGKREKPKDEVWGSRFRAARLAGKMEEEQIDEIKQSKEKRYDSIIKAFKTAPGQVGGQSTRERDAAITKHMGGDVHKGEIRRAMKRHFHTKGLMEDEQIDELNQQTLKAYKSAAKADRKMSKKVVEKGLDTDGKFKHAAKKRKQGIERASDRLEEKAPPGAKFERMVNDIKAGYAKDGLTKKEKGIAFATAWKARNREKSKD
jgi:hypothetical protein